MKMEMASRAIAFGFCMQVTEEATSPDKGASDCLQVSGSGFQASSGCRECMDCCIRREVPSIVEEKGRNSDNLGAPQRVVVPEHKGLADLDLDLLTRWPWSPRLD